MSLFKDVPSLLRAARRWNGVAQEKVARDAGVAQQSLSNYETGKSKPSVDAFDRILTACGIDSFGKLQQLVDFVEGRGDLREARFRPDDVARAFPSSPADLHRRMADLYEELETVTRRLAEARPPEPKE